MDSLVCVVYAQLFEGIMFEHLESVDIEHFYHFYIFLFSLTLIYFFVKLFNYPQEKVLVKCFRHRISTLNALPLSHRQIKYISSNNFLVKHQSLQQHLLLNHEKVSDNSCHFLIHNLTRIMII